MSKRSKRLGKIPTNALHLKLPASSPEISIGQLTTNMADEDEDLSHLRAPDAADIDISDETQDFRFLDKLTYSCRVKLSLPNIYTDALAVFMRRAPSPSLSVEKRILSPMTRPSNSKRLRPRARPCTTSSRGLGLIPKNLEYSACTTRRVTWYT